MQYSALLINLLVLRARTALSAESDGRMLLENEVNLRGAFQVNESIDPKMQEGGDEVRFAEYSLETSGDKSTVSTYSSDDVQLVEKSVSSLDTEDAQGNGSDAAAADENKEKYYAESEYDEYDYMDEDYDPDMDHQEIEDETPSDIQNNMAKKKGKQCKGPLKAKCCARAAICAECTPRKRCRNAGCRNRDCPRVIFGGGESSTAEGRVLVESDVGLGGSPQIQSQVHIGSKLDEDEDEANQVANSVGAYGVDSALSAHVNPDQQRDNEIEEYEANGTVQDEDDDEEYNYWVEASATELFLPQNDTQTTDKIQNDMAKKKKDKECKGPLKAKCCQRAAICNGWEWCNPRKRCVNAGCKWKNCPQYIFGLEKTLLILE